MKKNYFFLFVLAYMMSCFQTNANTINVSITNNAFTPSTFNAMVGDVIIWTWNSAGVTHNVTSSTIPSGAASFASGNKSTGTFSYTITTAGNYSYSCTIHQSMGMVGGFSVTSLGISEPSPDVFTSFYPNPFKEKVTIKYNGIESIDLFNIVGDKVKTIDLSVLENKAEFDFLDLPPGIYFYRSYQQGFIVETKKIVKEK